MNAISKMLMIGCGGFIGANARYWVGGLIQYHSGPYFPWGTLAINVSGSFLIGLLMSFILGLNWNPNWQLFLVVGVLGGYTTFSSFSYDAVRLLADKTYWLGLRYIFGSVGLSLMATWAGIVVARLIAGRAL